MAEAPVPSLKCAAMSPTNVNLRLPLCCSNMDLHRLL